MSFHKIEKTYKQITLPMEYTGRGNALITCD